VGGADVSEIFRGHEGYKYGAKSVKPDIVIEEVYTGDWNDSAAAKEAAISMYDDGSISSGIPAMVSVSVSLKRQKKKENLHLAMSPISKRLPRTMSYPRCYNIGLQLSKHHR
jgi:hypothetical protein